MGDGKLICVVYFIYRCPENKFRCATGACIDKKYLCDGVKHCIFGEDDEKRAICQNNT